jgi:hypothetical protein
MSRPVTLFTGQWADLTFDQICSKAASFGYDGIEIACWGDHFDVLACLASSDYAPRRWSILHQHGLSAWAISAHLVGQAVCDLIDERHKSPFSRPKSGATATPKASANAPPRE